MISLTRKITFTQNSFSSSSYFATPTNAKKAAASQNLCLPQFLNMSKQLVIQARKIMLKEFQFTNITQAFCYGLKGTKKPNACRVRMASDVGVWKLLCESNFFYLNFYLSENNDNKFCLPIKLF